MSRIRLARKLLRCFERFGIADVEKHYERKTWVVLVGTYDNGSILIKDYLTAPDDGRVAEFESPAKAHRFIAETLDL